MNKNITCSKIVAVKLRYRNNIKQRVDTTVGKTDISVFVNKQKVSSIFRGQAPLRGLNEAEEKQLLPEILGVYPEAANMTTWVKATNEYWKDISIEIPPYNYDGKGGGRQLEVGFYYETEEAKVLGEKEAEIEYEKYVLNADAGREYQMKFDVRLSKGFPINVADFVAYRFCLVHSLVANRIEDVNKSPNIKFYIEYDGDEVRLKSKFKTIRDAAKKLYVEHFENKAKIAQVCLLSKNEMEALTAKNKMAYDISVEASRQILFEDLSNEFPEHFIKLINDENLGIKFTLERCIRYGILKRIANTDRVMYENTILGETLDQCVGFWKHEQHKQVVSEIEAKLAMKK